MISPSTFHVHVRCHWHCHMTINQYQVMRELLTANSTYCMRNILLQYLHIHLQMHNFQFLYILLHSSSEPVQKSTMDEINSLLTKTILNNKTYINTAILFYTSVCYWPDLLAPRHQVWWHRTIHAEPPGWVHVSCTNSTGACNVLHQPGILCIDWYYWLEYQRWSTQTWKVVMIPALLSMVAPEAVIMTTFSATSDDKAGIMTIPWFQCWTVWK